VLDGLGHTRLLLDSSGNITDRYRYDAWGNPIEQVGTTFNPFRWNAAYGYEWTPATGLYHVGAREYDPRTARWLQRDPIDAASGDPNL
jgi:RHS repeat-associated protein